MSGKKKNIWLIDGTAIMYRAYFAFIRNPLINKKGENTGAVYGFVNSILKIIREEEPDYIAVVFDSNIRPSAMSATKITVDTRKDAG
ncbi:MAG: hypothetical protein IPH75_16305 [bacterium]|nr:hypothetical protein [bacterium]